MHVAVAGLPVQLALHSAAKFAWHDALQWALSALELHSASHCAVAFALQLAVHSNVAGWAVQFASHVPWQLPVQVTDGTCGQEA